METDTPAPMKCDKCQKVISWPIAHVSFNTHRKFLCIEHQIELVERTWSKQPVLQKRKIDELKKYLG